MVAARALDRVSGRPHGAPQLHPASVNGMPLIVDPQAATAFTRAAVPAIARMEVRVTDVAPGRIGLHLPLDPNCNHIGTMYAGALFALLELPGGLLPATVLDGGVVPIVAQVQIEFLRAARTDVTVVAGMDPADIRALAQVALDTGRAGFHLALTAVDAEDRPVVSSRADYVLRPA